MHLGAVPHNGEEERAALPAPRVIQVFFSEDEEPLSRAALALPDEYLVVCVVRLLVMHVRPFP